jgi:hypothetical protein
MHKPEKSATSAVATANNRGASAPMSSSTTPHGCSNSPTTTNPQHGVGGIATVREFLSANMTAIVGIVDLHDATISSGETYVCARPCQFVGNVYEWEQHLAQLIADKLEPAGELTLL